MQVHEVTSAGKKTVFTFTALGQTDDRLFRGIGGGSRIDGLMVAGAQILSCSLDQGEGSVKEYADNQPKR